MFYVSLTNGAVFVLAGGHYHLIGLAVDSDGVITITEKADDFATTIATYGPFCKMDTREVMAKFNVTPTTPMLPMALVSLIPARVDVFADKITVGAKETTVIDIATMTGATLAGTVVSSDTDVVTVAIAGETITYTPVNVGETTVTLTVADSQNNYADAVFQIPVEVMTRAIDLNQIPNIEIEAGATAQDIPLDTTGFDKVLNSVTVYSTDAEIVSVSYADDGTNATLGTITITPHATQLGEVDIVVIVLDVKATNPSDEVRMTFKVRVIAGA